MCMKCKVVDVMFRRKSTRVLKFQEQHSEQARKMEMRPVSTSEQTQSMNNVLV